MRPFHPERAWPGRRCTSPRAMRSWWTGCWRSRSALDGPLMVSAAPVGPPRHRNHGLVAPGEVSIDDTHYDRPRPTTPNRGARARTPVEREFLALEPVAEQFLTGAAAAGAYQAGHRDRRGPHPGRRARHRAAARSPGTGRDVWSLACR